MDGDKQEYSTIERVWIAIAILLPVIGLFAWIIFALYDGAFLAIITALGVILGIVILVIPIVVIYKFYVLLKAIYQKLDSFDIPLKPVVETKEDPVGESKDQKKEELVAEQPIEEKSDDPELTDWKERSIRGIKAGMANGRIDEDRGNELIRRVQAATQIPEPKK